MGSCNRSRHAIGFSLFCCRVKEIFLSVPAEDDTGDRPIERHVRDRNSCRCTDHSGDFGRAVTVNRKHFTGNDNIITQIAGEEGTHRAVNQAGSEHGRQAGLALAALEAAGNPADCVKLFIEINGKREVVNPIFRTGRSGARYKNDRLAVGNEDSCIAEFSQLADFHRELTAFIIHFKFAVIGKFSVLDNHIVYSLTLRAVQITAPA